MRLPLVLLLLAALAACQPVARLVDAETAELARFKDLAQAGDLQTIAAADVSCAPESDACRQLHLIQGDSCFELAVAGEAPRSHFDCAIEAFDAGLGADPARPTGLGPSLPFAEKQLEGLRRRQDLASGRAESLPYTRALITRATTLRAAHPESPAGVYYEASGRLTLANDAFLASGPTAAVCARFEDVLMTIGNAPEPLGRYAASVVQIRRDALPPQGCR